MCVPCTGWTDGSERVEGLQMGAGAVEPGSSARKTSAPND